MPIIGIVASSRRSLPNDYESIASFTVTGTNAPHITFSDIPNTYRHLQIRGLVRTDRAGFVQNGCSFQLNGDTGNNYNWNQAYVSNGSTLTSESYVNDPGLRLGELPSANAPTNVFGFVLLELYDYKNTNKYTTYQEIGGSDRNGNSFVGNNFGVWKNTAAVNSIKLFEGGSNWLVGSIFSLYGIKG
jgi:hypothetical protein